MLNEQDAKTKWCPHAVASHTDPRRGFNPNEKYDPTFPCIASRCMAWRWEQRDEIQIPEDATLPDGYFKVGSAEWESGGKKVRFTIARLVRRSASGEFEPQRGYCGLAGKPQAE